MKRIKRFYFVLATALLAAYCGDSNSSSSGDGGEEIWPESIAEGIYAKNNIPGNMMTSLPGTYVISYEREGC